MKKIPTLFVREFMTGLVVDVIAPGCEWVVEGQGTATRKFDGTCCRVEDGKLWKRQEIRYRTPQLDLGPSPLEPSKPLPLGYVQVDMDHVTMKGFGWVPVDAEASTDQWHREAFERQTGNVVPLADGTYELIGPKIQGNPERSECHQLVRHDSCVVRLVPRDFRGLRNYLSNFPIEGIVWHHEDGRMVKIKGRDFGVKR